jgi:hypothetical protein
MSDPEKTVAPWDPICPWAGARKWVWLALAILAGITQMPGFVRGLRPAPTYVNDFFRNWAAARCAVEGYPIYEHQDAIIPRYLGIPRNPADPHHVEYFTHPPASVLLALPLSALDYPDATLVWNLLSVAALLASLAMTLHALSVRVSIWALCPVIALSLICIPLRRHFNLGQSNLVVLFLITAAWVAGRSGRATWSGACLGLATAVKLYPGFLILFALLRGQWKTAAVAIAVFAGINAIAVALFGVETYTSYYVNIKPHLEECQRLWFNISLTGFWNKLFDPDPKALVPLYQSALAARVATAATSIGLVLALAVVTRRARSIAAGDRAHALAVTIMLLITPTVWDHYLVVLVMPLAFLWVHLPSQTGARVLFILLLVDLWIDPTTWWRLILGSNVPEQIGTVYSLTILSLPTYGVLVLLGMLACVARPRATADLPSEEATT